MILKTLERTTWEEIKVGEVFAWNGCWCIFEKVSDTEERWLACTDGIWSAVGRIEEGYFCQGGWALYKLPKSVQNLWRTP